MNILLVLFWLRVKAPQKSKGTIKARKLLLSSKCTFKLEG